MRAKHTLLLRLLHLKTVYKTNKIKKQNQNILEVYNSGATLRLVRYTVEEASEHKW